jgi:S1-C subfamily serine protease
MKNRNLRRLHSISLLFTVAMLVGCEPVAHYNRLQVASFAGPTGTVARKPYGTVKVFETADDVGRAYEIVGWLSCEGSAAEEAAIINAMLYRAADMGADGVLLNQPKAGAEEVGGNNVNIRIGWAALIDNGNRRAYRAQAIRFTGETAATTTKDAPRPSAQPQTTNARPKRSGTGFFISDDGYLLTCYHVVRNAGKIQVRRGNESWAAEVVKKDLHNDIAVLKATGGPFTSIQLIESSLVKRGRAVFTLGYPNTDFQGSEPKLTDGVVSSISGIDDDWAQFQISVPLQPGNSGGPLIDKESGRVIGVAQSKLSEFFSLRATGQLPQNVNFAVKSSHIRVMLLDIPELATKINFGEPVNKQDFDKTVEQAEKATVIVESY